MIRRFQGCRGLRLFRIGRWQAELWWCPRGEFIPMHWHADFSGRLVFLGGRMRWRVADRSRLLTWRDLGRNWRVDHHVLHGAEVIGRFGLFLNLERWTSEPTSAATDFHAA